MKRLLIAMLLVAVPTFAFAFDETRGKVRIGVLRSGGELRLDIAGAMQDELRKRGFDAFDAMRTYDEAIEDGAAVADYYVEIVTGDSTVSEHGGFGVGNRNVGVTVGMLVSRVRAELVIYDGETMKAIESHDLFKRNTALAPTSIGVGGGSLFAYVALPMIERAQMRRLVRDTGRSAAAIVSELANAR